MDNIKNADTSDWMQERLQALSPKPHWEPDRDRGIAHFQKREHAARRQRLVRRSVVLAVLIAGFVSLLAPSTRGVAERLFNRFSANNIGAVRSNLGTYAMKGLLPAPEYVIPPKAQRRVPSIAQAEKETGFLPRLPPEFI